MRDPAPWRIPIAYVDLCAGTGGQPTERWGSRSRDIDCEESARCMAAPSNSDPGADIIH